MQKLIIEDIKNVRLWQLMQDAEIKDAKTLARLLYENGYYTNFRENKKKSDEISDKATEKTKKENNIGSLAKIIIRVLYSNEYNNDSLLKACCRLFNCDADYLLERQPLTTKGRTDFNKMTGLSDHAIKTLEKSNNTYFSFIPFLNFLLEPDNAIEDKTELFYKITSYIGFSDNIVSYIENGVPKMENKNITLCDKYGTPICTIRTKDMRETMALSIITTLNDIKNKINKTEIQNPTIYDCLEQILDDILKIDALRKDKYAICHADRLAVCERRFKENKERLCYLYGCDTIDDIDFREFQSLYPRYKDDDIQRLKKELDL